MVRLRDPKDFRQRAPNGDWKVKGIPQVLYRLPQLLAAPAGALVFVVEGEKDADRLAGLGLVATTNPGGAGKWRDAYAASLAGRRVAILPDNDEPGRKHAEKVRASLDRAGVDAAVVELEGLPPKGDVSDWLDPGGTAERLIEIAEAALRASGNGAGPAGPEPPPREGPLELRRDRADRAGRRGGLHPPLRRHPALRLRDGRWFEWSGDHWRQDGSGRAFHLLLRARARRQ